MRTCCLRFTTSLILPTQIYSFQLSVCVSERACKHSFLWMAQLERSVYLQQKPCCLCLGDSRVWHLYQNPNMAQPRPNSSSVCQLIVVDATRNKTLAVYLLLICLPYCTSAKNTHTCSHVHTHTHIEFYCDIISILSFKFALVPRTFLLLTKAR